MKMKFKRDKHMTIEYPNGKTHGECLHAEEAAIKMIDGVFVSTLYIQNKPKRLSREKALHYYTQKLRCTWNEIIGD
jgi:hypothetical protein